MAIDLKQIYYPALECLYIIIIITAYYDHCICNLSCHDASCVPVFKHAIKAPQLEVKFIFLNRGWTCLEHEQVFVSS
jgi:hypothetical protein